MKMDKQKAKLIALFVVMGFTAILAAPSESRAALATANASATVIKPIAIGPATQELKFGKFMVGAGGTVAIATTGARTLIGVAEFGTQGTAGFSAASFPVTGENNATFSISLPGTATLSAGGGNTMTVGSFVSDPVSPATLDASGAKTLLVGATLTVGATQVAGTYLGTFDVTVDYN
jgi:hypothetical protein